jgi:cyanobactin maturation PatA/PatG family protease
MQSVEHGAHVINISGGERTASAEPHPLLANAIRLCADHDVLVVAAAGNDGCPCLQVPAAVSSTLAVGAMDAQGLPLDSSNWSEAYQTQGILAPGEQILGATPGGGVTAKSGTSFATPVVSGLAGLLLSIQLQRGENPDPYAVRAAILRSAFPCVPHEAVDCRRYLVGSLNIHGAFTRVTKGRTDEEDAQQRTRVDVGGSSMLEIGAVAPDFLVQDHTGRDVQLSDYRDKTVILWFYPALVHKSF